MTPRCIMSLPDRVDAGLCRGEIPEDRVRKKAVTCSNDCQREYRRLRRGQAAEAKCRLCGRRFRHSAKPEAVLMAHGGK